MTTDGPSSAPAAATVSLARLPVFDDKRRLWGYELFCVGGAGDPAGKDSAANGLAQSAYMGVQNMLDRGKKIVLDFNAKGLLDDLPYVLPPASAVVKVDETVGSNPEVVLSLKRMKTDGFLIAIDQLSGTSANDPLYKMADIIAIGVTDKHQDELFTILENARALQALTMAMGVADPDRFDACRQLGFSL
ncbi:MAG: hypothetical protein WCD88_18815, partial [Desulfobacterales bacterium]